MHRDEQTVAGIRASFEEALTTLRLTQEHLSGALAAAADIMIASLVADGTVFLFGNGGSAADAQHIAAELVGRFLIDRRPLRAIALTTDTSILSAVSNDYTFDMIFARQLEGLARAGDVAIALTTSGNSPNVVEGLTAARRIGMKTIAFTGAGGGKCAGLADILLDVPHRLSPRIQEAHACMYHILCAIVEQSLTGRPAAGEAR